MSDDYGLFINPKDGGKPIEITNNSYPLTFLKHVVIHPLSPQPYQKNKSVNVPGMSKYNVVIVPSALCHFLAYGSVQGVSIGSYWVSGDTFYCNYDWWGGDSGWLPGSDGNSHFFLYGVLKEAPQDSYGLFINSQLDAAVDNFRAITQESTVSYCVFRQKIFIQADKNGRGYWSVPDSIPNRNSVCVFIRPENTSQTIRYDRPNNRIISLESGWVYVVIFASGLNLQPSDGLTIWNREGKVVFNSEYTPFYNNGQIVNTSNNVATSKFDVPMFTMDSPNTWLENEGNTVNCYMSGFRVSGKQLIAKRMWTIGDYPTYANYMYNKIVYAGSYAIDFNDYF
ncbi:hypothetical protein JK188_14625 [Providencia sp. JGM181]|uniref:DUF6453 family protein n=1 Tax=Providencia sp. JGM181 TaxID=2799799 RepID=UPI001BAD5846|nr:MULTISPECIES: DUF6453 family protein [unclassified Providencia]MBS0925718.1 hypothetical protein [Providencia sp. JGM181]MBS0932832.1 hypothetical protein [Providencia sp. JGM172]MBS0997025.1 hypothetical protein [Providencia sp. JGM178]